MNIKCRIALCVAIIVLVIACDEDSFQPDRSVSSIITATLPEVQTKTSIDGWQTSWDRGDAISVFVTRNGSNNHYGHSTFIFQDNGTFAGQVDGNFSSPFNWFAIYPAKDYGSKTGSVTISINHPRSQRQTDDSNSHICGNNTPLYGFAFGQQENPVIPMRQVASVLDFNVKNETASSIKVKSIRFTAPEKIAGDFTSNINLMNMAVESIPQWTASATSSYCEVELIVDGSSPIPAGSTGDYYAAIHPISANGSYTIEVTAISDGRLLSVTKTLNGNFVFSSGKYKTINFTFESPEETVFNCIENPRLEKFLDKLEASPYFKNNEAFVSWNDNRYSYTLMTEDIYGDNSATNRWDQPAPVIIFLDGTATSLEVYEDSWRTQRVGALVQLDRESAEIYNLIPGKEYWYTARGASGVVSEGSFTPTGRRRMMKVSSNYGKEYAMNCRDLGGLPTVEGNRVKYGLIYRGTKIDYIKKDNQMLDIFLNTMGITLDVDLRSSSEKMGYAPDLTAYGVPRTPQHYTWRDTTDLRNAVKVRATLGSVMTHVLADRPVYIHCSSGADRTGYFCLLIEALLGVNQNWTDSDYELTSFVSSLTDGPRLRTEKYMTSERFFKNNLKFLESFEGNSLSEKVYDYVVTSPYGLGMNSSKVNNFIDKMTE